MLCTNCSKVLLVLHLCYTVTMSDPLIILASKSPRRIDLLTQMGLQFKVVPSNFDEMLDDSRPPDEVAQELALHKAMTVARQYPDSLVIGSDTIVTIDGKQLEKPRDTEEAYAMLKLLSGKPNEVSTGVAIVRLSDGVQVVGADTTRVYFKEYDQQAVETYVQTGDPMDKAGAYGIQSGATALISHIEGKYDTVVGLPTELLADMLARFGITASPVMLTPPVKQILLTA